MKKLTKNLILRTLRQLYAVSEIIILIRWVTPPQKLKIFNLSFSSVFEILQFSKFFNFTKSSLFPSFFFIRYTQPNLFTNSSCAFYLKLVQNLHCVLSAEEIANETLKQILSSFLVLLLKPFRIPRCIILFTHDLTRCQLHSTWVTHVKRMRRVRGTFVQNLRANSFSPWL